MLNKLAALQQRYSGIQAKIEELSSRPKLDSEGATQLRELKAKAGNLLEAIHAERESQEAERELAPVREAVDRDPSVTGDFSRFMPDRAARKIVGANPRTFGAMFGQPQSASLSIGEFMSAIHGGLWHPKIGAASMSEATGADGGYFVPPEFAARMLDISLESEIVRPRARIEPMTSASKKVAGFDTTSHTTSIAGFSVVWPGESGVMTAQKGLVRAIELKARKAAILAEASNELIGDGGQTFEDLLIQQLGAGIGFGLDEAFLVGTGNAQPLGVLSDPALVTVSAEGSQTADTIVYENLVKMLARLHPACFRNSVWVANVNTLPQLLTLQQKVKNVAGSENVGGSWVPVLREDGSGNMTLLTRPLILTEKLPTLGDAGDIMLADFSQYVIGMRAEMSIAKSQHLGFDSDSSHYRVIVRVDGQGSWKGPMAPRNGSDTLSWCVTLAPRA